jgi:hypothetical protein
MSGKTFIDISAAACALLCCSSPRCFTAWVGGVRATPRHRGDRQQGLTAS